MSYTAFLILILIVAIALILIVMVQNPKGGGLSSSFGGGAQSLGGVQNTNNFLDRTTWTLAIAMFALILLANFAIPRDGENNFKLDNTLEGVETSAPVEDTTPLTTNDSI
ncbi:preprotein translocase subunit SecG [Polaribacter sp. WD7]|uniref:preprotein translocase subunit SecG n=1 Tax=Polaribacter sp. WD7 TaxID=2269061 RepID=UPI000DF20448|nr:preprotein translocase subunit SecG [Polaribacter sp. WD7]RCS27927.1 preprotein translocase subunit SecG [Polaribacter sp. WD7]